MSRSAAARLRRPAPVFAVAVALLTVASSGCSLRTVAVRSLARSLADSASVYASDRDPELVRDALPFALKTFEALLETDPDNRDLLLGTCSAFTQYAHAFVLGDAERLQFADLAESRRQQDRAIDLFLRARDYCLRGLALATPGVGSRLALDPAAARSVPEDDVDLLYWTAAAWGSAISAGVHRAELVADLPVVRTLLERGLEVDPDYERGAFHEASIAVAALPEAMGGSRRQAERHYRRAVELAGGRRASPHLTWATAVLVPAQEAGAFRKVLDAALAVDVDADPQARLANRIAHRRARFLLDHVEEFFLDPGAAGDPL